jgi:hypothetical protein
MMSRDWLFVVARSGGTSRGDQWNTQRGRAKRVLWLFRGFYAIALIRVG